LNPSRAARVLGRIWFRALRCEGPLLALAAAGLGLPILDRAKEDLQATRGFVWRRDLAMPELLEARKHLVVAFSELGVQ
jgi:hypothetical protein